ncbi:MAG: hypothetical protein ACLT4H_09815 [Bacteroides thetaiotaomicron]
MIAAKNQTVNHTPKSRIQVFYSVPFICKADTNRTHLCPYWAETFLAQSSGRFALIALNFLIEIFLFPHA